MRWTLPLELMGVVGSHRIVGVLLKFYEGGLRCRRARSEVAPAVHAHPVVALLASLLPSAPAVLQFGAHRRRGRRIGAAGASLSERAPEVRVVQRDGLPRSTPIMRVLPALPKSK